MAKWQHIRNAQGMRLNTIADLLMDDGKVIRATWQEVEGVWCDGRTGSVIAWYPAGGKPWRSSNLIPQYTPLSFRIVAEGASERSSSCSYEASMKFLSDNGLTAA